MTAEVQRANVRTAAQALAPIAGQHQLVLSHGNGPQVGLLALQAAAYTEVEAYPLDVLGAQTEGMIGYLIEQELGNLLPAEVPFATILTMIEVDAADPAFADPTKFVGPVYDDEAADALADEKGWVFKRDGERMAPRRAVTGAQADLRDPTDSLAPGARHRRHLRRRRRDPDLVGGRTGTHARGVEAVIDKDLASELLAREVDADLFIMATDVDGVYDGLGHTRAAPARSGHTGGAATARLRRRFDGAEGGGRRSGSWRRRAGGRPSAR